MVRFRNLGINAKFNIIVLTFVGGLFVFTSMYNYSRQQDLIISGAIDNARIIAREIIEARDYMSSVVRDEPAGNYNLVPQVVATQVARRITQGSQYYVRQVSLRYRNPENRPDDFETDELKKFSGRESRETWSIVRKGPERELRYLLPMHAEKSCLECHGSYDSAPHFVKARFPRGHFSYGYRLGEVIGAVSVSVPMTALFADIRSNLGRDIAYRAALFLIFIVLLSTLVRRTIIGPVLLVGSSISRVARTGAFTERLPARGNDEVGQLVSAFNDLMGELERKTLQSRESEQRYRNFIKMAQSAVVSFMDDGKIIITNEKAEVLLGISRRDLLGENIFDFIEDGEAFQESINAIASGKTTDAASSTTIRRIKNAAGFYTDVEVAISASTTEGSTIFTAILREAPGK